MADIDRGGVFASIYGTLMLLEADERAMVKGIIVNKFRGDVEILRPGLEMIEEKTGVPGSWCLADAARRYRRRRQPVGTPDYAY